MGSESRQRELIVTVRVDDAEYAYVAALAAEARCSMAEIVRAKMFDRDPVPSPVPCSPRHPNCTRHHRDVVDGYRDQRYREELAVEEMTGNHDGDRQLWRENGGRMTTFAEWLNAHRRTA